VACWELEKRRSSVQVSLAHDWSPPHRSESEVLELFGSDSEFCRVAEYEGKVVGFVMGTTISKRRSSWRYGYLGACW